MPTVAVPKAQNRSQYLTVIDVSGHWADPLPRLSWGGTETRTRVMGGHLSDAYVIKNQRAGRGASHHSIVRSAFVIALRYYTRLPCGPVSAVGAAREGMEGAGDACQPPFVPRSRSSPRLTPSAQHDAQVTKALQISCLWSTIAVGNVLKLAQELKYLVRAHTPASEMCIMVST
jgi:hypothetical protein